MWTKHRRDRIDEDIATGDLRALARRRAYVIRCEELKARDTAVRHHGVMYCTGVTGVVAGGLAGVAVVADAYPWVAGVGAFLAGAASGAQTVLRSQTLANQQWLRRAGLGRLAQDYETTATAKEEPTKAEMNALAKRWEELYHPIP
jgi:hypothetical protein